MYRQALTSAMTLLSKDPRVVFLGQAVKYPGTAMSTTLSGVPDDRKIELPVAEEMQMGQSIGLALQGFIPVSIYPRWNFLLLAANQLVNHLDKLPLMGYRPKVIVRTSIGSESPMHPGPQHVGDFTDAFRAMCGTVRFVRLWAAEDVVPAYEDALKRDGSTVLVEFGDLYD
jgi:pyruvate/2-oxoglutarate/acetoin dehydrogenase E1 component